MTMLPFPAWTPDISPYQAGGSQLVQNVVPRADGYGPVKSPQAFTAPIAVEGNDSSTKVLLHFEGADAGTVITDSNSGGSAHTWAAAGNANTDDAQFKFGYTSLACDGTGDYVTCVTDSADFTLGSSFTIDFWFRCNVASGGDAFVCGQSDNAATAATISFYFRRSADDKMHAVVHVGGTPTELTSTTSYTSATNTGWHHAALVRSDALLMLFLDGVLEHYTDAFAGTINDSSNDISVGRLGELTTNTWNGWLDEFRISSTARWTQAFTPPAGPYDTVANSACRGFFYARNEDGTVTAFAGTSTDLYKLSNTTLQWQNVSKAGSYAALPTTYHWQFAQFGNIVIAVKPSTNPQEFTLGSSSAFADLAGSPPQASYIAIVGQFVVLAGLTSDPFTIAWSALGSAIGWTPGTDSSDTQDLPDGGIVRGVAGGEYGIIFQETTMRRIIYNPGSEVVFTIEKIADDTGLLAPYSLTRAGDRIFFLSPQGYRGMLATGQPEPVGKEIFDRFLFTNYDPGAPQYVIGAADPQGTRVYLTYKSASSPNSYFDRIIVYDYALQRAAILIVNGEYLGSLAAPGITLDQMTEASAFSNIDTMTVSLDDIATATGYDPFAKLAIADTDHKIGFFSGDNLEAVIDTSEQGGERRFRVKGFRPVTDAATCYGAVGARETTQETTTYSTEQAVNMRGLCPANVSTRLARGRVRIPAATTWAFATGIQPEFSPEGKR